MTTGPTGLISKPHDRRQQMAAIYRANGQRWERQQA
jgi:hypothetical protein